MASKRAQRKKYDYQEVDRLVKAYQGGDNEAALKLIQAFSGFIGNFVQLVKNGVIDTRNICLRRFIALFMKNRLDRYKVIGGRYKNDDVRRLIFIMVSMITKQFRPYDEEDIWSELVGELLAMAKKYHNDKGCFFHVYVSKAFHYRAYKRLSAWTNDPVSMTARNYNTVEPEEFEDEIDLIEQVQVDEPLLALVDDGDTLLDENWINGNTCAELFSSLSPLERRVLVLYYDRGWKDREIGEEYGFSTTKVRRIRNEAKMKLAGDRESYAREK